MNTSGISAYVIQLKDHHNGPLVCDYLKDLLPYVRSNTRYLKKPSKTDVCLHYYTVVVYNCKFSPSIALTFCNLSYL